MPNLGKLLSLACGTKRDRDNQLRILPWTAAWMGLWLVATFAIKNEWISSPVAVVLVAIVLVGPGLGTMLAYRRYLREADELIRKIELDALALTVGVGLVTGLSYWLLELAEIADEPGLPMVVAVMMVTYSVGVILGHRRYA